MYILLSLLVTVAYSYELTEITFNNLKKSYNNNNILSLLESSLSEEGIVVITNVPRLKEAREKAFTAISNCLATGVNNDSNTPIRSSELADGTIRRTIASPIWGSMGSGRSSLISQSDKSELSELCNDSNNGVNSGTEELRLIIDRVSIAVANAFDDLIFSSNEDEEYTFFKDKKAFNSDILINEKSKGRRWKSFNDIVNRGDQLEHFHTYYPPSTDKKVADDSSTDYAIDYHTDAGLYLLFTPALYNNNNNIQASIDRADFKFIDSNGVEHALAMGNTAMNSHLNNTKKKIDTITLPEDAVVLMIGQGAEQWLNPHLKNKLQFRAVPHAVQWNTVADKQPRIWYGRMFLPPADSYSESDDKTFSERRQAITSKDNAVDIDYATVGCGLGSNDYNNNFFSVNPYVSPQLTTQSADDCYAGTIYCWMTCMPLAPYNLTCPVSEITCVDEEGNPVDPDEMAPNVNHPGCVGVASYMYEDEGGFCQGSAVTMYMQGFVSYVTGKYRTSGGSETPQCLALWFEEWELDTKSKFAWGCVGCVLLGIMTESLSFVRRETKRAMRKHPIPAIVGYLVLCTLYGAQLALGYLDMLVAMTYQVELFVCIVAGLAIGHGIFAIYFVGGGLKRNQPSYGAVNNDDALTKKMLDNPMLEEKENDAVDPCCQYLHVED